MRISSVLLGLVFFIAASNVQAQGPQLTPRQIVILREVGSVDGSLSRKQYDEFWADFHKLSAVEREHFRQAFRAQLPATLRYQRALWLAAQESLKQHKPVITPELRKEFELAEKGSRDQSRVAEMKRTAQILLEGAAYQIPVNKDGRAFPKDERIFKITPEAIEQVLLGLDGSINRFERLLSQSRP